LLQRKTTSVQRRGRRPRSQPRGPP
jgi:hypothetical protein